MRYDKNQSIEIHETAIAVMIPMIKGMLPNVTLRLLALLRASLNSAKPEKEMAGIPSRNANLAASFLVNPLNKEVVKVIPDLDTPGIKEKT